MDQSISPIEQKRHSLAHILAMAVLKLRPDAKLTIGPAIEDGFYYDFQFKKPISDIELETLTKIMQGLVKQNLSFERTEKPIDEAIDYLKKQHQPFKVELAEDLKTAGEQVVSFYQSGDFIDLCRGGHVRSTSEIDPESFTLTKTAGAYWKGSEKNSQLQRIYGMAFETKQELDEHLKMIEEAKKRDHKKIGIQLELFMFHPTAPGMAYWLPKGLILLNELIKFWRKEHSARHYQEIKSPLINKKELYQISGHWEHYLENMFISKTEENEIYALKPMNCPNAMVIYGSKKRSYRELPLRLSDTDTLHRYERSGTLSGLLRAREFSQDDAHIFITEKQIEDEYRRIFEIAERFYSIFDLSYSFRLGTRPEKFIGDVKSWDRAEKALKGILIESQKKYTVLEKDGAFYGPKIDILMKDSLGRQWQMGTIQLDFQLPKRFSLSYTDIDGKAKTPVVIHRVIYGSLERFIGIITEHFAGKFPVWLSPCQVQLIPISEKFVDFAHEVASQLTNQGIRSEINNSDETVSKKIRQAQLQFLPYMLVLGEREQQTQLFAVRTRDGQQKNSTLDGLIAEITKQSPY